MNMNDNAALAIIIASAAIALPFTIKGCNESVRDTKEAELKEQQQFIDAGYVRDHSGWGSPKWVKPTPIPQPEKP